MMTKSVSFIAMQKKPSPRQLTERYIKAVWEPIDALGSALIGDLWSTLYESIQDAIALSLLLKIPSWIGFLILGKQYSGFDACFQENEWEVDRYACFVIVVSDLLLWLVLAGRVLGRFVADIQARLSKRHEKNVPNKS
jgi:hypothetical protein